MSNRSRILVFWLLRLAGVAVAILSVCMVQAAGWNPVIAGMFGGIGGSCLFLVASRVRWGRWL